MAKLIQNAVYIPEDDLYLVSESPDEPSIYTFRDGKVLALQGGLDYALRGGDFIELLEAGRYEEFCLVDDDPDELINARMLERLDPTKANTPWVLLNRPV